MNRNRLLILLLCLMVLVSTVACSLSVELTAIDENDAMATAMQADYDKANPNGVPTPVPTMPRTVGQ